MIVKTLKLDLYIPSAMSLKDKRSILKSLIKRCHQQYNVSIAEIEALDEIKHAKIGIAIVSNSNPYTDKILDKCINLIKTEYNVEITGTLRERN